MTALPSSATPIFSDELMSMNAKLFLNGGFLDGPRKMSEYSNKSPKIGVSQFEVANHGLCLLETVFRFHPLDSDSYLVLGLSSSQDIKNVS